MVEPPIFRRRRVVAFASLIACTVAGATAFVVAGGIARPSSPDPQEPWLEATHLPPLLTLAGEGLELGYDVSCLDPAAEDVEASCDPSGSVFLRAGTNGAFRELALRRDGSSGNHLVVRVPDAVASPSGFTYYAEIEAGHGQTSVRLPPGGPAAPHRSLPLLPAVEINLGRHRFGETRRADERVVQAAWGPGAHDVGLEQGRIATPIGASAFDVDESGTVVLLDQAHGRVLRWRRDAATPARIPLPIEGTLADVALARDGTLWVLESVSQPGRAPLARQFDPSGRELGRTEIAERSSSQVRIGPEGPVVLQQPSGQWMPLAADGFILGPDAQRRRARTGRPLQGGDEVVVLRIGDEARVALVGPSGVRHGWRVASETHLAEVQLAEPLGQGRLVLVVRVFSETQDEFEALVLDGKGVIRRFALPSADWAETAPLGRFRLVGKSLYQLGSTPAGAFVDRFDLEVP